MAVIVQGALIDYILSDINEKEEPTDEQIDSELPYYFEVVLTNSNRVVFSVDMLSEAQYSDFLKNIVIIKSHVEKTLDSIVEEVENVNNTVKDPNEKVAIGSITKKMENFEPTFYTILSKYSKCLNPEFLVSPEIVKILNTKYKDDLSKTDYYILYRYLYNISHKKSLELYKYNKFLGKIKFLLQNKIYKVYSKLELDYLKELAKVVIEREVTNLFSKTSIEKMIPVLKAILSYNNYKVKKKLQILETTMKNLTEVQSQQTFILEQNLVTLRGGDGKFRELKYTELSQKEDGTPIKQKNPSIK